MVGGHHIYIWLSTDIPGQADHQRLKVHTSSSRTSTILRSNCLTSFFVALRTEITRIIALHTETLDPIAETLPDIETPAQVTASVPRKFQ